jgi:uncharacterized protein YbgA (DUF1722 family)
MINLYCSYPIAGRYQVTKNKCQTYNINFGNAQRINEILICAKESYNVCLIERYISELFTILSQPKFKEEATNALIEIRNYYLSASCHNKSGKSGILEHLEESAKAYDLKF